jgi:site-specific recombinase XerD
MGNKDKTRRCIFVQTIRWEFYPHISEHPHARDWLETQVMLGLAENTIHAYGRGANDYLAFCGRTNRPFMEATKADIVAYIDDMTHRANPKGGNMRYLHSGVGLSNATMLQRLTIVRLLYDYLIDERIRLDQRNPVGKGKFTPGRAFAGKRERGILQHYEQLPWIPGDDEWDRILEATLEEPLRNRLMLLLAYDGALRRSELVALQMRDISFPHQQITIRSEIAKNGRGRVVMYGDVANHLLQLYLEERADEDIYGGLLFRSQSDRNHTQGMTADTWDKVVTRIAKKADLHHRFTTHTPRHLRLTDLARTGMDLHTISQYAGHRSLETTKIYIKLSGRETAERVRTSMQDLDRRLERLQKENRS